MERGQQGDGEIVGVDVGREPPIGMEGSEAIADGGRALFEPSGDKGSGLRVALSELTTERTEQAASLGPPKPFIDTTCPDGSNSDSDENTCIGYGFTMQ